MAENNLETICFNCKFSQPAFITVLYSKSQLLELSSAGGCSSEVIWLRELQNCLLKLSKDICDEDVTKLFKQECLYIHKVVQQRLDMKSEKFFPKIKQTIQALRRWQSYGTPQFVGDFCELMNIKNSSEVKKCRLPTPALFHHLLSHLVRGYHTLRQAVFYCEEAAFWLQGKMYSGQRSALSLALFSIVSRLRILSQYFMECMVVGYDKLIVLLHGFDLNSLSGSFMRVPDSLLSPALPARSANKRIGEHGDDQRTSKHRRTS